jgi:hypothetical protein
MAMRLLGSFIRGAGGDGETLPAEPRVFERDVDHAVSVSVETQNEDQSGMGENRNPIGTIPCSIYQNEKAFTDTDTGTDTAWGLVKRMKKESPAVSIPSPY